MTSKIKWRRIVAGEYTATVGPHTFDITHRETPDLGDGYGRRDDWVLIHTGPTGDDPPWHYNKRQPSDPYDTLREAKRGAEHIIDLANACGEIGPTGLRCIRDNDMHDLHMDRRRRYWRTAMN